MNLASRLTEIAPAGAIYASDALHADLADDASFTWAARRHPRAPQHRPVEVYSLLGSVRNFRA